ncbi:hypothetical protein L218DRAFT_951454 [Marasmius fiardii PR-910]|nr:hypothetical protein L218DRAFT_951454 [Marasmius fiardii PR-910]
MPYKDPRQDSISRLGMFYLAKLKPSKTWTSLRIFSYYYRLNDFDLGSQPQATLFGEHIDGQRIKAYGGTSGTPAHSWTDSTTKMLADQEGREKEGTTPITVGPHVAIYAETTLDLAARVHNVIIASSLENKDSQKCRVYSAYKSSPKCAQVVNKLESPLLSLHTHTYSHKMSIFKGYNILNAGTGKYVDLKGSGTVAGTPIILNIINQIPGTLNQQWRLFDSNAGDSRYLIQAVNPPSFAYISGAADQNTQIVGDSRRTDWEIMPFQSNNSPTGAYIIRLPHTNLVWTATADNEIVLQTYDTSNQNKNQQFTFKTIN